MGQMSYKISSKYFITKLFNVLIDFKTSSLMISVCRLIFTYFRASPDRSVLIYSGSILLSYILMDYIESHVIMPIIQSNGE